MLEAYTDLPLPEGARQIIEAPPVPFDQLEPYDPINNLYELDERPVDGGEHKVHQFLQKVGGKLVVLTQVETSVGAKLFDLDTPHDKAKDRLVHTFASAPVKHVKSVYPSVKHEETYPNLHAA